MKKRRRNNKKKKIIKRFISTIMTIIVLITILSITVFLKQNKNADATYDNVIIKGKATLADGTPVGGVKVELIDGYGNSKGAEETKADGTYELNCGNSIDGGIGKNYKVKYTYGNGFKAIDIKKADIKYTVGEANKLHIAFILPQATNDMVKAAYKTTINNVISQLENASVDSVGMLQISTKKIIEYSSGSVNLLDINFENSQNAGTDAISAAKVAVMDGIKYQGQKAIIVLVANTEMGSPDSIEERLRTGNKDFLLLSEVRGTNSGELKQKLTEGIKKGAVLEGNINEEIVKEVNKYMHITSATQTGIDVLDPINVDGWACTKDINIKNFHDNRITENIDITLEALAAGSNSGGNTLGTLPPGIVPTPPMPSIGTEHFIEGKVFENVSGVQTGIEGVLAELWKSDGTSLTPEVAKTTDVNGDYYFARPDHGSYVVKFTYGYSRQTAYAGYNGQDYIVDGTDESVEKITDLTNNTTATNSFKKNAKEMNRNQVNEYWKEMNNKNAKMLAGQIATEAEFDELVSSTNITAQTQAFSVPEEESLDAENTIDIKYYANLCIKKRDPFTIELEKRLNAVKLTLANGQEFRYETDDPSNNVGKSNENVPANTPPHLPYVIQINEELMHGARVDIEYLLKVTSNISGGQAVKIIDYLDFDNNSIVFDENTKLLTEDTLSNSDYGWKKIDIGDFLSLSYIESGVKTSLNQPEHQDKQYLIYEYDPAIHGHDKDNIKLVVSRTITGTMDADKLSYGNEAEIIMYTNDEGRRDERTVNRKVVIPGNYNPIKAKYGETVEPDNDKAPEVTIIPPLGEARNISNENIIQRIINKVINIFIGRNKYEY